MKDLASGKEPPVAGDPVLRGGPPWRRLVLAWLSLNVVVVAVIYRDVWRPSPRRYVIIHSDDAGMYPSVNRATIDALEAGVISSCSIMVPCPGFAQFAVYASRHPEKDFGVHLTLTCDTETFRWGPVAPKRKVASLLAADGGFWPTSQEAADHAKLEEAETELRAQIDKARDAGIRISHLDHHMFVLFRRPDLLRLYVKLSRDYDLPIRYMEDVPSDQLDASDPEIVAAYREGLKALRARGMPVFREIDSRNYGVAPEQKRAYYLDLVGRVPPGVTEFLIHCGYGPLGPEHAPNADRREADTRVFLSQEMRDALRSARITVIDWKQFRAMGTGPAPAAAAAAR